MTMSSEDMCQLCPQPLKVFLDYAVNLKFDEAPKYAKYISLFYGLIGPYQDIRPIKTEGAERLASKRIRMMTDGVEREEKKIRLGKPETQWISVYCRQQDTTQSCHIDISDGRIAHYIEKGEKDGLFVSCVASCGNLWSLVIDSANDFTDQVYKISCDLLPNEWILEQWRNNYHISALAGRENKTSFVVMSKGTNYMNQIYKVSDTFPSQWIYEMWEEKFFVTAMATSGSNWAVVMSRNSGFLHQVIELDFLYPSEGIHQRWKNGYLITAAAATAEQTAFVLSIPKRKDVHKTQETLRTTEFPFGRTKEKWDRNFYLTALCYGRTVC